MNVEISGDISDEERAAIEALFDRILEVANGFFGGASAGALDRLRDMAFDTGALAHRNR